MTELGQRAKVASRQVARASSAARNEALHRVADLLVERTGAVLTANAEDLGRAERALTDLEKDAANADRLKQVRPALERAAFLNREGKRQDAERIWTALEALYRNDPGSADLLAEISRARKQ